MSIDEVDPWITKGISGLKGEGRESVCVRVDEKS